MAFSAPDMPVGPTAPKPPRPFGEIQGKKPQAKSMQQSFIGAESLPGPQSGGKTLLGQ